MNRFASDHCPSPTIKLISGMAMAIIGDHWRSSFMLPLTRLHTNTDGGMQGEAFNAFDANIIQTCLSISFALLCSIGDNWPRSPNIICYKTHLSVDFTCIYEMWNVGHKIIDWNYYWSWLGCSVKFERERSDMTGPFIMTPEMYCTWATARNINNQLWPECIKSSV